jgi:hypothetical protein
MHAAAPGRVHVSLTSSTAPGSALRAPRHRMGWAAGCASPVTRPQIGSPVCSSQSVHSKVDTCPFCHQRSCQTNAGHLTGHPHHTVQVIPKLMDVKCPLPHRCRMHKRQEVWQRRVEVVCLCRRQLTAHTKRACVLPGCLGIKSPRLCTEQMPKSMCSTGVNYMQPLGIAPARRAKVFLQKPQQRGVLVLGRLTLPLRQSLEGCRRCGG